KANINKRGKLRMGGFLTRRDARWGMRDAWRQPISHPASPVLLPPVQPAADHQPVHGLAPLVGWRDEHRVIDPVTHPTLERPSCQPDDHPGLAALSVVE